MINSFKKSDYYYYFNMEQVVSQLITQADALHFISKSTDYLAPKFMSLLTKA